MVYYAPGSEGAKRRDEAYQKQLDTPLSEMMNRRWGVTQKEVDDIRARSKRPMSDKEVVAVLVARMPVPMSMPQQPMLPVQPKQEDRPPGDIPVGGIPGSPDDFVPEPRPGDFPPMIPVQPQQPEPKPWQRGDITPEEQRFKDETGLDPEDHANGDAWRQWIRGEGKPPSKPETRDWNDLTKEEQDKLRFPPPGGGTIGLPDSGIPVADEEPTPEQPAQRAYVVDPSKPLWAKEINGEIISGLQQGPSGDWFNKDGRMTSWGTFMTWDELGYNPNKTVADNFGQEYADALDSYNKDGELSLEENKSLKLLQDKYHASQKQQQQQQAPPGLSHPEWQGMDTGVDPGGGQQSMMDLWGGGGQQAPTQQWGGQQGWQRQEQGQTFQDPITGRTLDRRTGQPVEQQDHWVQYGASGTKRGKGTMPGHTKWADVPEHIRNSPEMKENMSKGGWSPNESTQINLESFLGANPHLAQQPQQQQQGWQDFGGWQGWGGGQAMPGGGMGGGFGGMGNMFPGMQMPPWATLPGSNLVGQPQQPMDPGYGTGQPQQPMDPGFGTGQPGQNIPGAGVIPGLPAVSPVPGAAPELGQYGQEIAQAANTKLQQAPQSGVPSGSPVVYPSSQAIAPTTRQGGGGRRGGGGASPFSYGVRVQ